MDKVSFPFATLEYEEPIIYLRILKGVVLDDQEIRTCIEMGNKMCNYKPHTVLVDARVTVDLTPEARALGADREINKNIIAQAIVVKWLAQRLIANVFVQINKPHYPVQVFNDEAKAVKWLLERFDGKKTHEA